MISLESSRWTELRHAYGTAEDIPDLLRQLETFPAEKDDDEPWHSLWSALCHQGDVYPASFAAIPHIVRIAESDPKKVSLSFFSLPVNVEICRRKKNVHMPSDLRDAYLASLASLPALVASTAARDWDADFASAALSAIAAAKGFHEVAEAIQEMTPEVTGKFMDWLFNQ